MTKNQLEIAKDELEKAKEIINRVKDFNELYKQPLVVSGVWRYNSDGFLCCRYSAQRDKQQKSTNQEGE